MRTTPDMMIRKLREHFPARIPEWANAWLLLSWGAYTLLHPGVFEQAPMQGLVALSPVPSPDPAERFWGMITILVGAVRLAALFINGAYSRTPIVRLLTSLLSAFVWAQILNGIFSTGVPAHGLVMYSGALVLDLISAYRAGCDTAIAEATRRMEKAGGPECGNLSRTSS